MAAGWLMRGREGFTLVELLVAVVLLVIVFMGLQGAAARFAHDVVTSDRSAVAIQLAEGRIAEVRMHPNYATLDSTFAGTEVDPGGEAGLQRLTRVDHTVDTTAAGVVDYKTVTVTVTGTGLPGPVARTMILAAP